MRTKMNREMRVQIAYQTRKIKRFRVTAGVRPNVEIVNFSHKIQSRLTVRLLSKNAMLHENPSTVVSFTQGVQFLPIT